MAKQDDKTILFQPMGRRSLIDPEATILEQAGKSGVGLEATCGGKGICGKCKVKVDGPVNELGTGEAELLGADLDQGYRLACHAKVSGPATVWVPESSRKREQVILTAGAGGEVALQPSLAVARIKVDPPELGNPTGLRERCLAQLNAELGMPEGAPWRTPQSVLAGLAGAAAAGQGKLTVVARPPDLVLDISPGWDQLCLGAAMDLGTTTMVVYLYDLVTGERLAVKAEMNPQVPHGEDVISRISLCEAKPDGLAMLAGLVHESAVGLARQGRQEAGLDPSRIFEWVVVGNTAMHHIFLGLEPGGIARPPYAPVASSALEVSGAALGMGCAPQTLVYTLPVKAGFVGADTVAAALATEIDQVAEPTLLVDLGTNGELVLATPEGMLCCSTAAGPAFEGGHIKWGMRAAPGAVEKVAIDPATLVADLQVIGQVPPVGVCGSGLVSLVSQLVEAGAITPSGGYAEERIGDRVRHGDNGLEYVLAFAEQTGMGQDLVLTHGDLAELQLAKAAIHAGVSIMMSELGVEKIESVLLAGAFGNYLDPVEACGIGMLPGVTPDIVTGVGNAAGDGAVMVLLNSTQRARADRLAAKLRYLELAAHPQFNMAYIDGMAFPSGTAA